MIRFLRALEDGDFSDLIFNISVISKKYLSMSEDDSTHYDGRIRVVLLPSEHQCYRLLTLTVFNTL